MDRPGIDSVEFDAGGYDAHLDRCGLDATYLDNSARVVPADFYSRFRKQTAFDFEDCDYLNARGSRRARICRTFKTADFVVGCYWSPPRSFLPDCLQLSPATGSRAPFGQ